LIGGRRSQLGEWLWVISGGSSGLVESVALT
jgi:hypothetical protein